MKRRKGFATVVITAAITFGTLFAFAGPRHFNRHHCGNHYQQCDKADANKSTETK